MFFHLHLSQFVDYQIVVAVVVAVEILLPVLYHSVKQNKQNNQFIYSYNF